MPTQEQHLAEIESIVPTAASTKVAVEWNSVKIMKGHESSVTRVAFSTHGLSVASGSDDQSIKLWDVVTGTEMKTLRGHEDSVNSVAFSPNGTHLASASEDFTIRIWDVATGAELKRLQVNGSPARNLMFSPDGKFLVFVSGDKRVRLWDTVSRESVKSLVGHTDDVLWVAFSPDTDSQLIASSSLDQTLRLWNTVTGLEVGRFEAHTGEVVCMAFSLDGKQITLVSKDGTLRIWDTITGTTGPALSRLQSYDDTFQSIAFSPDGTLLALGSHHEIRLWNTATGKVVKRLDLWSETWSMMFSPDGQLLAVGSSDEMVRLWKFSDFPDETDFSHAARRIIATPYNTPISANWMKLKSVTREPSKLRRIRNWSVWM